MRNLPKYDYIFFVPREYGYRKDGVRLANEDESVKIDEAILNFLNSENIKCKFIIGNTKERAKKIELKLFLIQILNSV